MFPGGFLSEAGCQDGASKDQHQGHLKDDHRMRRNHLKGRGATVSMPFSPPPAKLQPAPTRGAANLAPDDLGDAAGPGR
jgi:hypothetical protein